MHYGSLPPNAAIRPWVRVGELVRDALPPARIPPLDPSEDRQALGVVGQPFQPYPGAAGAMSEATLIQAHRACTCCPQPWEWFRRRQRVMAQRTAQREARAKRGDV